MKERKKERKAREDVHVLVEFEEEVVLEWTA